MFTKATMERVLNGEGTIESIFGELDSMDENANTANEIVEAYDSALAAATSRLTEKEEMKQTRREKKKDELLRIVDKLKALLGDVPWKDAIFVEHEDSFSAIRPVRFKSEVVQGLMKAYIGAPSKATKQKLLVLKNTLRKHFCVLQEQNFLDFSFLSKTDPMESVLYEYYSTKYPNQEHVPLLQERSLELLCQGELLEALGTLNEHTPRFSFKNILSPHIAASIAYANDADRRNADIFAAKLYDYYRARTPGGVRACYQICMEQFPVVRQQILDFLSSPETTAWKESRANGAAHGYTVREMTQVANTIWKQSECVLFELVAKGEREVVLDGLWRSRRYYGFR